MSRTALFANKQPGGVFTIEDVPDHPGNIFFVDSGHADKANSVGSGRSPDKPFSTITYAITQCTANNGDVIYVMPGHAETLATASAIAFTSKAGVTVIGVGTGADKPTLTFSNTAATVAMNAASCKLTGIRITPSVDSVVSAIVVSAADCVVDIEVLETDNDVEFVRAVLTTAAADRLDCNLVYNGRTGGNACVNAVRLVGCDGGRIHVDFYGKASTAVVEFHTTACTNVVVTGRAYVSGTTDGSKLVVDTVTGSTWYANIEDGAAGARFTGGSGAAIASDDVSSIASALGTIRTATGTTDIDDSEQTENTAWWPLLTIEPATGAPLRNCKVYLDLDKTTTGFADGETTATIQFRVARKVDGTNWRGEPAAEAALAGDDADGRSAVLDLGLVSVTEDARIEAIMSADASADMELPYLVTYEASAAATVTPVAAA